MQSWAGNMQNSYTTSAVEGLFQTSVSMDRSGLQSNRLERFQKHKETHEYNAHICHEISYGLAGNFSTQAF